MQELGFVHLKNISQPVKIFRVSTFSPTNSVIKPAVILDSDFTSLIVMQFTNLSGVSEQDFLVDGLAEGIKLELGRFKNLVVIARNTSLLNNDPRASLVDLGLHFGVDFVLTGSVRILANRVRVTVQLVDVQLGAQAFAEKFDREMDDIFAFQDEIVEAIVGRLFFNLPDIAASARQRRPSPHTSAYTHWLRGGAAWRNGDERLARDCMHEAILIDPNYARALGSLSLYYAYWQFSEPSEAAGPEREEHCRNFAKRAIAAEKNDPYVLTSIAASYLMVGEIEQAMRYSDSALSMSPRDINVMLTRGYVLAFAGKHEEGLALVQRACSFEPHLPPAFISSLGDCLYLARRFDDALNAWRSLVDPPFFFKLNEAACLAQLGRPRDNRVSGQWLNTFDAATYARSSAKMCALAEDRELWLSGYRKAGVAI